MAIANFEEFCKGLAEIVGMEVPQLETDEDGRLSFSVLMQDVYVTALHIPTRPDAVFLMAELGPMPDDIAVNGWRALMEANMHLLGKNLPTFSRDPESHDVILQRTIVLDDVTVIEACEQVDALLVVAHRWRDDHLLSDAPAALAGSRSPQDGMFA